MTANIFDDLPQHMPQEVVQTLLLAADGRIERIISHGHASAKDFWYDQPQHEWVIVLKGVARLQFEDGMVVMKVGDFINIPAFKKHRVDWTTPDEPTVWLGFSVSNGFWNTIWIEDTVSTSRFSMGVDSISVLPSEMSPALAVSSPSSTFASVDFPQPDSPTMATVSDSRASKLMVSFALTVRPSPPPNMPPLPT